MLQGRGVHLSTGMVSCMHLYCRLHHQRVIPTLIVLPSSAALLLLHSYPSRQPTPAPTLANIQVPVSPQRGILAVPLRSKDTCRTLSKVSISPAAH